MEFKVDNLYFLFFETCMCICGAWLRRKKPEWSPMRELATPDGA